MQRNALSAQLELLDDRSSHLIQDYNNTTTLKLASCKNCEIIVQKIIGTGHIYKIASKAIFKSILIGFI